MEKTILNLMVNGQPYPYTGNPLPSAVLTDYGAKPERVALVLNDQVLPREQWAATTLSDGDRLEIIVMAGGG